MDSPAIVTEYYRCLDEHEYETLKSVLAADFMQYRPDRTFEDRTAFISFMRDDRPLTNTRHRIETVKQAPESIAVYGRLLDSNEEEVLSFIDVFEISEEGTITNLRTHV